MWAQIEQHQACHLSSAPCERITSAQKLHKNILTTKIQLPAACFLFRSVVMHIFTLEASVQHAHIVP